MQTEIKNSSSGGITIAIVVLIVAVVAFFILGFTTKDKKPTTDNFTGGDDKKGDEGGKQIKTPEPTRQRRMMRIPVGNGVKAKPFGTWHPEELQSIGISINILNRVLQVREELKASNSSPDNLIKYLNNPAGPGMDPFSTMKQVQMAYNAMYGNEKQGPYSLIAALKGVHDQFGRLRPTITHLTEFTDGVSKKA